MRNLVFIINPKSGTDNKVRVISQVEKFCTEGHGFKSIICLTEYKNHATELAAAAVKKNADVVVAVGGDGTVNEVAKSLKYTTSALGILPCGSGNGLARHFNIPMNLQKALRTLETGTVKTMDSMLINDMFSLNISGVGYDAYVAALFASNGKRGLITYAKLAIGAFSNYKSGSYTIKYNKTVCPKNAFLIVFANGSQWGNNALIAPSARTDDGLITLGVVENLKFIQIPAFVYRLFNGTLDRWKGMSFAQSAEIKLESSTSFPLHVDGEAYGLFNTVEVVAQPASLKIIIPCDK